MDAAIWDLVSLQDIPDLVVSIFILGGMFKLGDIVLKKITSARENADTDAVAVTTLEKVLTTVVNEGGRKEAKLELLETRVSKLEERERHMLTRAAVHEAWDQMAFQFLVQHDPNHPPPPSLYDRELFLRHDNAPTHKPEESISTEGESR
jgi:hypothetical protein